MANKNLNKAKKAKNDEFYTLYHDIEKEISAYIEHNKDVFKGKVVLLPCDDPEWSNFTKYFVNNFKLLGLKKLISTSYSPQAKGKILSITDDANTAGWEYLTGDGDFRSDEVKALRDEADIIVTNPPFSLFREFMSWVFVAQKTFLIIGNANAAACKSVFPLIKDNRMWFGATDYGSGMVFAVPQGMDIAQKDRDKAARLGYVGDYTRLGFSCWFTNIDHGRRHREALPLMTMADNLKLSRHKVIRERGCYESYENYNAIEVPYTDSIPSDYEGVMGVPVSFLGKYSPEQFEILGMCENENLYKLKTKVYTAQECKDAYLNKFGKKGTCSLNANGVVKRNGLLERVYQRILIKHKNPVKCNI